MNSTIKIKIAKIYIDSWIQNVRYIKSLNNQSEHFHDFMSCHIYTQRFHKRIKHIKFYNTFEKMGIRYHNQSKCRSLLRTWYKYAKNRKKIFKIYILAQKSIEKRNAITLFEKLRFMTF